jgi:hypothetical protein
VPQSAVRAGVAAGVMMEAIGRFTVTVAALVAAYIALKLLFLAAGVHVQSDASYWFGFIMGSINLMITRVVAK